MYLILLKDRSSWLRFLSWSKASLGTSFREFRATFSRRRSLGKLWSVWACVGMFVTAANHWSYGCKYNIVKGSDPSELIPIRASCSKERLQRLCWIAKLNHGLATPPLLFAFNTDHAKTISNAKRPWNKKYIFFPFHSLLLCPFGTFGDHISV